MKYRTYVIDKKTTFALGGKDVYILPSFTANLDCNCFNISFGFLWFSINTDIYFNTKP